jgi:hypothetical protein
MSLPGADIGFRRASNSTDGFCNHCNTRST